MPCCKYCECIESCTDRVECCDMCPYYDEGDCTREEDAEKYTGEEEE